MNYETRNTIVSLNFIIVVKYPWFQQVDERFAPRNLKDFSKNNFSKN